MHYIIQRNTIMRYHNAKNKIHRRVWVLRFCPKSNNARYRPHPKSTRSIGGMWHCVHGNDIASSLVTHRVQSKWAIILYIHVRKVSRFMMCMALPLYLQHWFKSAKCEAKERIRRRTYVCMYVWHYYISKKIWLYLIINDINL